MIFERELSVSDNLEQLYAMIRRFEGLYLTAYFCPAGVLTIGYGTTGSDIYIGMKVTKEWAEARMKSDLRKFVDGSRKLCPDANLQQLCAIADFSYNLGLNALKNSTFRKKFNAGDIEGAKREIVRWNKAGGKVLRGLTIRRQVEAQLL